MDLLAKQRSRFKHIQDWDSLKFLLPAEYLQMIHEPEGVQQWDSQGSHGSSHSSECQQCHMRMSTGKICFTFDEVSLKMTMFSYSHILLF